MKKLPIFCLMLFIVISSCSKYIQKQIKQGKYNDEISNQDEENRSKEWPKELELEIKPNTMHEKLQNEFKQFSINNCNCINPKKLIIGKKYDYIPKDLVRLFGNSYYDVPVEVANDISNFSLFFYPFSLEQKNIIMDSIKFEPKNIISVEGINYTIPYQSDSRLSGFFYSNTCSQYLFGSFDGKLSMPVSAIEAGLKAESQQQSTLIGVGGYFNSPLDEILKYSSLDKYRTFFYLWDFYSSDKSRINKDFYYINSLKAISFKTAIKSEQMELFKIDGNLNVKAGISDISSKLSSEINQTSFFSGQRWKTYIDKGYFNDNRSSKFTLLSKPEEIKKFIEEYSEKNYKNLPIDPMYQNLFHSHYVIFTGIPTKYKSSEEWYFVPLDTTLYYGNVSVEIDKSHLPDNECLFKITGKPNDKLFSVNESDYKLFSYVLRSTKKVGDKSLDLKVSDIGFEINKQPNLPNITVSQEFPYFSIQNNSNKYDYRWTFKQNITDEKSLFTGLINQTVEKIEVLGEDSKSYIFNSNLSGKAECNLSTKTITYEVTTNFETTKAKTEVVKMIKANVVISLYIGNNPKRIVKRTFQVSLPTYEFITKEVE